MRVEIDPQLKNIVPGYLIDKTKDCIDMKAAMDRGDFEGIRAKSHSLKGSGGGYGFKKLSDLGAQIEAAAKKKNKSKISSLLNQMQKYLEQVEIFVP